MRDAELMARRYLRREQEDRYEYGPSSMMGVFEASPFDRSSATTASSQMRQQKRCSEAEKFAERSKMAPGRARDKLERCSEIKVEKDSMVAALDKVWKFDHAWVPTADRDIFGRTPSPASVVRICEDG